jgi:hypothetical protein
VVPETDESNNCSATYFVFTVAAMPECSDGDDNNDNELIDLADTFACTDAFDATEETLSSGNLSLEAFSTGSGDVKSGIVKPNTAASLHWSVANIIDGTCVITGENGDVVNISGASGSSLSQLLKTQTIYTLTCSDLNNQTVSIQTIVRIAPEFEER